jgi:hypothetical protein
MIAQTYVYFNPPISLDLRIRIEGETHEPNISEFSELPLVIHLDAVQRTITVHLPPIPAALQIYGPEDFIAACGDTPEEHAQRVMQILGSDPASVMQAMIHTSESPALPPRISREIANWRAKAVLATMGMLSQVTATIAALPEPDRTVVSLAWAGDAKLARRGKTVLALASALGLTDSQLDELFVAAEAIEV